MQCASPTKYICILVHSFESKKKKTNYHSGLEIKSLADQQTF